ncbi:hypothetical protein Tco_0676015 [Tanacetum coccineum]
MPLTHHASTSTNPDPMISPAFVEANYEEYDEEREIVDDNRSHGMNLPLLLAAHLGSSENGQPLQSFFTSAYEGRQPSTNIGGNPHPNDGLKMPSHVGSYDGKGDPDNYLHLFEGSIQGSDRFQKNSSWDNNKGKKNRDRFSSYRGSNHGMLSNLSKCLKEILATEKVAKTFEQPPRFLESKRSKDTSKYCHFHEDHRHDTNQCQELRHQIEEAIKSRQLAHLVKGIKKGKAKISDTQLDAKKKSVEKFVKEVGEITFSPVLSVNNSFDPVIIHARIFKRHVNRVYMDSGSSCKVIYEHRFLKLKPFIRSLLVDLKTLLVGFFEEHSWPLREVPLEITIGDSPLTRTKNLNFIIVRSNSPHNLLLGKTVMQKMGIVAFTIHEAIKFHTPGGIGTVFLAYEPDKIGEGQKRIKGISQEATKDILSCLDVEERIIVNETYPEQTIAIEKQLPTSFKKKLRDLLKANVDVFTWTYAHMIGIPRTIMVGGKPFKTEHQLNEFKHIELVKQKKRGIAPERNEVIRNKVEKLTKANILREVKYQTWVSNPVMVRKDDER